MSWKSLERSRNQARNSASNMEKVRKVLQEADRDANSGEITKEFIDTFMIRFLSHRRRTAQ